MPGREESATGKGLSKGIYYDFRSISGSVEGGMRSKQRECRQHPSSKLQLIWHLTSICPYIVMLEDSQERSAKGRHYQTFRAMTCWNRL